jgi:ABC-type multidrug transport system ATPase subunit
MDEVTSSLDAKTESIVIEAIMSRVRKGATAVLIAHRLSSVQQCDMILVMRDGEIIERGTHAELLHQGGGSESSSLSAAAAAVAVEKIGRLPKNMSISNIEQKVGWYSEAWSLQSSSSPCPFSQKTSPTWKKKAVSGAIEADQLYSGEI